LANIIRQIKLYINDIVIKYSQHHKINYVIYNIYLLSYVNII
jgi:hypothetical protein